MYNLLAVDDDKIILEQIEDVLTKQIPELDALYTASNIRQAQGIIMGHEIHILLCDIEMPQGTGLELLEWIRREQRNIITLFLTGFASFEYARKALTLGSFDYLLKPISSGDLENAVRRAMLLAQHQGNINHSIVGGLPGQKLSPAQIQAADVQFWRDVLTVEHGSSRAYVEGQQKITGHGYLPGRNLFWFLL